MNYIYSVLGLVLTTLFFLNIRSAADLLCRIVGGFALLFIYNAAAPLISLTPVGINLISSSVAGIMGLPGAVLLICCNFFF